MNNGRLSFEQALAECKKGVAIWREHWSLYDRSRRVVFMPPMTVPEDKINARTARYVEPGCDLGVSGYFVVIVLGVWIPGWHPTTLDMVSDDWFVDVKPCVE